MPAFCATTPATFAPASSVSLATPRRHETSQRPRRAPSAENADTGHRTLGTAASARPRRETGQSAPWRTAPGGPRRWPVVAEARHAARPGERSGFSELISGDRVAAFWQGDPSVGPRVRRGRPRAGCSDRRGPRINRRSEASAVFVGQRRADRAPQRPAARAAFGVSRNVARRRRLRYPRRAACAQPTRARRGRARC